MRRAAKVDENQEAVIDAMRKCGATVTSLHRLGGGVVDLLVSFRQKWLLIEVKSHHGRLNAKQRLWIRQQRGPVYVVKNPKEAVDILNLVTYP